MEASLRRDLPIITTTHAKSHLTNKGADSFTDVCTLDPFESQMVNIENDLGSRPSRVRVTGMPGKHVPQSSVVEYMNSVTHAVGLFSRAGFKRLTSSDPPYKRMDAGARHRG